MAQSFHSIQELVVGTGNITDGAIVNADINASAAIAFSKLQAGIGITSLTPRSGYWYQSPALLDAGTTAAITANRLYAEPIYISATVTLAKLGVYVTTGSATNLRFGLYNDNGGLPGSLLVDAGAVSANVTNAEVSVVCTNQLTPGWYWIAMVGDGTPTMQYTTNGENLHILGMSTVDLTTMATHVYKAFTYGALSGANPFGAVTDSTSNAPALRYQIT